MGRRFSSPAGGRGRVEEASSGFGVHGRLPVPGSGRDMRQREKFREENRGRNSERCDFGDPTSGMEDVRAYISICGFGN